jgi:hypothetical protein
MVKNVKTTNTKHPNNEHAAGPLFACPQFIGGRGAIQKKSPFFATFFGDSKKSRTFDI